MPNTTPPLRVFIPGDRVAYTRRFLKAIGSGPERYQWRGTVHRVQDLSEVTAVHVSWDQIGPGTFAVLSNNLRLVRDLHKEPV